jgi:glycosyltransferase involved in cell wall biosynthesis
VTVSAVLPTKNRAVLLAETVRALLAQTVVPEEIVIVDQSATDDGRRAQRRTRARPR